MVSLSFAGHAIWDFGLRISDFEFQIRNPKSKIRNQRRSSP